MFEIFGKCKCLFIIIFNVFNENNDKYVLSDESYPNGSLILMMNPFQIDGKKSFIFPYLFGKKNHQLYKTWFLKSLWNLYKM